MGSSPESQLILRNGEAIVHPIAGTFKRTGDDTIDEMMADKLLKDAKENAEHVIWWIWLVTISAGIAMRSP